MNGEQSQRPATIYNWTATGMRASERVPYGPQQYISYSDHQRMLDALRELVALKDLHDEVERLMPKELSAPRNYRAEEMDDDYKRRKPLAWQAARDVLAGTPRSAAGTIHGGGHGAPVLPEER